MEEQAQKQEEPKRVTKEGLKKIAKTVLPTLITLLVGVGLVAAAIIYLRPDPPKREPISFHMTPPTGWTEMKPAPQGVLSGYQDLKADTGTGLKPFITVQISAYTSAAPTKATIKQFQVSYESLLANAYQNYKQLSSMTLTVNGYPAVLVTFSATQTGADVTIASLFTVNGHHAYSVNGETLSSRWDQYRADIDTALRSFSPK